MRHNFRIVTLGNLITKLTCGALLSCGASLYPLRGKEPKLSGRELISQDTLRISILATGTTGIGGGFCLFLVIGDTRMAEMR